MTLWIPEMTISVRLRELKLYASSRRTRQNISYSEHGYVSAVVRAGEETELLVGIKNNGEGSVNLVAIKASVHMPYDHKLLVQNLTAQEFNNATVPSSAQASFRYIFAVNKFLQPALFDLVGTIVYEIDQRPYQSTFYNGTIEVVGFVSFERLFLMMLASVPPFSLGLWTGGQIKSQSKNSRKASKGLSKKKKKKEGFKGGLRYSYNEDKNTYEVVDQDTEVQADVE